MNKIVLKENPQILDPNNKRDFNVLVDMPKEFIFDHFYLEFPYNNKMITVECLLDGEEPSKVKYSVTELPCYFKLIPEYINEENICLEKVNAEYGFEYRWGCLQIWDNHMGTEDYTDMVWNLREFLGDYISKYYYAFVAIGLVVHSEILIIMEQSIKRKKLIKKGVPLKHKYSREHRLSIPDKKIWLFDDIVQYTCDQFIEHKGKYTIQCPCWEVRGHYRHYKSGKVVFIKSFKKGKHKETAEPINHEYYIGRTAE